jgi:hypothetical protein
MTTPRAALLALALVLPGCGSDDPRSQTTRDPGPVTSKPDPVAPFTRAELVPLFTPPNAWFATALAFDPTREGDLWVVLRQAPSTRPCNSPPADQRGCAALVGEVALVTQAGTEPSMKIRRDGNAWHFMRRPTSIAFGDGDMFATCGESRTDNYDDENIDFAGPVLWSSDPTIFGVKPLPDQNGTHVDMLHETPFCMGIAHETANTYFTFNGKLGAIDHYDFKEPHVVGGEDHSDGEVRRYVEGQLLRVPEVPSHLALETTERKLYIADTGHHRVVRLDIDSGARGADIPTLDPIEVHYAVDGATLEEIVAPGIVEAPSGIAFAGDKLVVTDNSTSRIFWFDHDGKPLGSFDTGLPEGSLSGIAVGPDDEIYLSDMVTGNAYRVEPK